MKLLIPALLFLSFGQSVLACDLDCTLKRHLDAIQAKDFKSFESTLSDERLTFILPDGAFSSDPVAYREVLKEWFTGDWTFAYKVISVEKTAEMGSVLLLCDYNEADRDGKPYHLDHYLSLVFKKSGDKWLLVHDQNTTTILKKE